MRWPLRRVSPIEAQATRAYRRLTGPWPKVLVLPWGWCLHVFAPGTRHDTFLVRVYEAHILPGWSWTWWGWRVVLMRVNHIPHEDLLQRVDEAAPPRLSPS